MLSWVGLAVIVGVVAAACDPEEETGDAALAERGEEALIEYGCLSCHAIDDLPGPQGGVGPPLDGIAERRVIAGELPNTRENLAAWIANPQEIDPGNVMPDVGVSDDDAEAIAEYLQSLD
ncbi:c-type cytochrome [Egibacter rhizosphaerae]|uniref:c-type cytochrome n=1 Tax=Egibacter rhizosphaerae TaxID=1670831 RepID=UPI0013F17D25|nr:c-type cytochrome [Egibacter rhizosphaerae]